MGGVDDDAGLLVTGSRNTIDRPKPMQSTKSSSGGSAAADRFLVIIIVVCFCCFVNYIIGRLLSGNKSGFVSCFVVFDSFGEN